MTHIVLCHHAQGLTPGVTAFAERLRAAGHDVRTPDLFDGRTFDSIEAGMSYVGELGFDEVMERGTLAADALGDNLVFAGFSLGVVRPRCSPRPARAPWAPCSAIRVCLSRN